MQHLEALCADPVLLYNLTKQKQKTVPEAARPTSNLLTSSQAIRRNRNSMFKANVLMPIQTPGSETPGGNLIEIYRTAIITRTVTNRRRKKTTS